ncbi:hypothetical protein PTTG_07021 [Puccinia triticina 1-1 BBBD Race 1]|uniref:Retrotran_gag_3 domain-containing protein n=1 Tax=Puccinia triticina (isolate 1-1 / race 1 (BBBD)) TaxID=630390 RepID=A0A0C4F1Q0_PUCT1|nr:hypothetical protein PTTG_07021 [Puccinia triticina 1-1 BBBD Race 1]
MSNPDGMDNINQLSIPLLNGNNYAHWSDRMMIYLRGRKLFGVCKKGLNKEASEEVKVVFEENNNLAILLITARLKEKCFNEVVNSKTRDSASLLWSKIGKIYASQSVINRGNVFMKWSAIKYTGELQLFINTIRKQLREIELVKKSMPGDVLSYEILGKIMGNKEVDMIVNKIALSEEAFATPYSCLDSL